VVVGQTDVVGHLVVGRTVVVGHLVVGRTVVVGHLVVVVGHLVVVDGHLVVVVGQRSGFLQPLDGQVTIDPKTWIKNKTVNRAMCMGRVTILTTRIKK